jgi:hypothetical protein
MKEPTKNSSYLRQPCVHPFLAGHKLQFLIDTDFLPALELVPGEASTKISAG